MLEARAAANHNRPEMFGFLNIRKPPGPTSHDVVAGVRRLLGRRVKVGHAGTLDPFAEGVLVVCVGPATRLAQYVQAQAKRYTAEVTLGATSTTDDPEGEIAQTPATAPGESAVQEVLAGFVGEIWQVPPAHSAVHVAGQRAYKLARRRQAPDLPARTVTVHRIELLGYEYPHLRIDVTCGSGTYVRALARDVGAALGVGGYCSQLTRTAVGAFGLKESVTLEDLRPDEHLIDPMAAVRHLPRAAAEAAQIEGIRLGRPIRSDAEGEQIAVTDPAGGLVAIAAPAGPGLIRPVKVFIAAK